MRTPPPPEREREAGQAQARCAAVTHWKAVQLWHTKTPKAAADVMSSTAYWLPLMPQSYVREGGGGWGGMGWDG